MTYDLCIKIIGIYKKKMLVDKLEEFKNKIDVYYAANRITEDQYRHLSNLINS